MKQNSGKLSFSEFDRVVSKTLGGEFLDRSFAARREGLSLARHVELAKETLGIRELFSEQRIMDCPKALGLLILRTAMSVLASGREPRQCSISLVFPLDYSERQMRDFVEEAGLAAKTAGIWISQVDISRGETEKTFASVSISSKSRNILNTGSLNENLKNNDRTYLRDFLDQTEFSEKNTSEAVDANDRAFYLVLIGNPAAEGTILLGKRHSEELEKKYSKQFLDSSELEKNFYPETVIREVGKLSPVMITAGEGGVFAALWKLLENLHLGMEIELPKIKLDPLTVEICETLDISPYELNGGGAVIAVTDVPEAAVAVCTGAGVRASVIGVLKKGNDRLIINGDEKRFLEPYRGGSLI